MTSSASGSEANGTSQWWRGLSLVLLATLALSCQNVLARIAQSPKVLPVLGGIFHLGQYVPANADKLQVSLVVLMLRVSFVVPLLWLALPILKKGAWAEAKAVVTGGDRSLQLRIVTAGLLLFLSQTGTYLSIANVGPAIAVTIFFIYPTVTTLLAWKLFGDRPSWQQWVAIGLIYSGCTWLAFSPPASPPNPTPASSNLSAVTASPNLPTSSLSTRTAPNISPSATAKESPSTSSSPVSAASLSAAAPKPPTQSNFVLGVIEAVIAGIVFAMEGIIAQSCFSKINPAVFTGMIFTVELGALLVVTIPTLQLEINQGLVLMGFLLSLATLSGYLFNNFGIKAIGAASTAIIGSSGPAVTAILAFLIIADGLTLTKTLAILIVTFGVVLMNLAKAMKKPA